jgi:alkanesulfonate monooxygenase SsuD/methylene tetrahydromethanopterin reductase-like flavin-dependent oxidoreductase (luciferase family)
MNALWVESVETVEDGRSLGPAPSRRPRPRLWVGGYVSAAAERAVRFGDGYLFGAAPVATMSDAIPRIREVAAAAGRADFPIAGLAYMLASTQQGEIAEGERLLTRYYQGLPRPFDQMVSVGDDATIGAALQRYRGAGLDLLYVLPVGRAPEHVDRIAAVVTAVEGGVASR